MHHVLQVLLRLAEDERFVSSIAAEPDYEEPVLRKARDILTSKQLGEYEHAARLEKLMSQVWYHTQLTTCYACLRTTGYELRCLHWRSS